MNLLFALLMLESSPNRPPSNKNCSTLYFKVRLGNWEN